MQAFLLELDLALGSSLILLSTIYATHAHSAITYMTMYLLRGQTFADLIVCARHASVPRFTI